MPVALSGTVAQTVGMTISVAGFPAPVGAMAEIQREAGAPLLAEVIGFRNEHTLLIRSAIWPAYARQPRPLVAHQPLAARGRPIVGPRDRRVRQRRGRQTPAGDESARSLRPLAAASLHPPRIDRPLSTGVRRSTAC